MHRTVLLCGSLRVLLIVAAAGLAGAPKAMAAPESYCDLAGYHAPLRQTFIVLDEAALVPEKAGQVEPANAPWKKLIGSLLLPERKDADSVLARNFEPRERVSLLIARKDGSGIKELLADCLPFFSAAERQQIENQGGLATQVRSFFGTTSVDAAKKDLDRYGVRLAKAIGDALEPSALSAAGARDRSDTLASAGLVQSLRQAGAYIDLSHGVPRIILYSDISRYLGNIPAGEAEARRAGVQAGEAAGLDLKGADVDFVGKAGNPRSVDVLGMFLLASHAELVSTGSVGSSPAPNSVERYQGQLHYPGDNKQYAIQIRLVTDINGKVMNSWFSMQATTKEWFSPFHGVVTCGTDSDCEYSGDEQFAQVWNTDRSPAGHHPSFDATLPFGGARKLSFKLQADHQKLTGSISDPAIIYHRAGGYQPIVNQPTAGKKKPGSSGARLSSTGEQSSSNGEQSSSTGERLPFEAVRQPKALF